MHDRGNIPQRLGFACRGDKRKMPGGLRTGHKKVILKKITQFFSIIIPSKNERDTEEISDHIKKKIK